MAGNVSGYTREAARGTALRGGLVTLTALDPEVHSQSLYEGTDNEEVWL